MNESNTRAIILLQGVAPYLVTWRPMSTGMVGPVLIFKPEAPKPITARDPISFFQSSKQEEEDALLYQALGGIIFVWREPLDSL